MSTKVFDPFEKAALSAVIPMTPSQSELWMAAQQSEEASCAYNLSISVSFAGEVDKHGLQTALQDLVERHEGLRASFAGDSMSMCIAEAMAINLAVSDLSTLSVDERKRRFQDIISLDVKTPFDLTFGPLLRAHLIFLAPGESCLLVTLHHLIADGWTVDLLIKELASLYNARVTGTGANLPPAYQFTDYAMWLEKLYASKQGQEANQYWASQFQTKMPALELPVDHPRARVRSFNSARTELLIDGKEAEAIHEAATQLNCTFFIFAFTNYVAFLSRITGQDDFVVAVPAAGQLDAGENQLAGHCVNTLPLRCRPQNDTSFSELLGQCKKNVYAGFGHTPFTYGELMGRVPMDRDTSRPPLASTILTVDQESHKLDFHGLSASYRLNARAFENFEMQVALVAQQDRIEILCQYNSDLFEAGTAERRMREFATLLQNTAENPHRPISDIELIAPRDAARIAKWNDTAEEFPQGCTLHDLFEEQAEKTPDAIALEFAGDTMSYRDFNARTNKLANFLVAHGVGPNQPVGICTQRSFEMLISIYSVLKAGGAYVPLDPDYPRDRLAFIFEDSGAKVVLTQDKFRDLLPLPGESVFCVDSQWSDLDAVPETFDKVKMSDSDLAYIIYTSGSTGRPKGVMNEHRGICNQLLWMQKKFAVDGSDNILLKTAYSFDVSIWELFLPLLNGARLVISPPEAHRDPQLLDQLFRDSRITGTCFVPSLLSAFLSGAEASRHSLRWIISIGEAMTPDLQNRFLRQLPGVELHNLYGPTEAAVAVTHWHCRERETSRSVPIGRPTANVQIHILDAKRRPVPIGIAGELYIGGIQVARGYLNRDDLNEEAFVEDPFREGRGNKIYRTGDLARWTDFGVIEYLGRVDFQIKFSGQRIELGEIESVLEEHSCIDNSVVIVNQPNTDSQKLVAYYCSAGPVTTLALREHLAEKLPPYMIPQLFMELDSLPLNTAGKVDRKALPPPLAGAQSQAKTISAPTSVIEKLVADLWSEFLPLDEIPVDQTFFDLGGTSLQALRLVGKLSKLVNLPIQVVTFFEYPTVAQFSSWLAKQGDAAIPEVNLPATNGTETSHQATDSSRDVAIIGMAGSFPDAPDVDTFWQNLLEGRDSIRHFAPEEISPIVDASISSRPNYVRARGVMPDADKFDAHFFSVRPREAQVMDPQQRVFIETCWHALEDAAIDTDRFSGRIGVFGGTGDNTYLWNYVYRDAEAVAALGDHQVHILNERDFLTSRVAYKLNLKGPAVSVNTACSTSLVAICQAVESIRAGQCDTALAGGVSIPAPQDSGYLYQEGGIGSADGVCRPFDEQADGTVFSSGSAAVVLRRLDLAERDGDHIYGVIRGVALNNDGADKMSFMAPSANGQRDVINSALRDAGTNGAQVSYVETHGTGTPIGDPIEFSALASAYHPPTSGTRWIGSVKGNIGHLDSAAGIAGFIKVAKAMDTGLLPGTAHFVNSNPALDLETNQFEVPATTMNWRLGEKALWAGVSSFGIGGTNAHVILRSFSGQTIHSEQRARELVLLSADSEDRLGELGLRIGSHLEKHHDKELSDAAFTLARGRKRLGFRSFAAGNPEQIIETVNSLASSGKILRPLTNPKVAFVFPGQGSQHIGMGKGLYENSSMFRETFDQGAGDLIRLIGIDLRELLFHSSPEDSDAIALLTSTRIAQPALFLVQYSMARHWMNWGLSPVALTGHSIGEFAAAALAGVFSFETALELVAARGRLIQQLPTGSMLSVRAGQDQIEAFIGNNVSLAAVNSPSLCVVSGPTEEIKNVARKLETAGLLTKALQTSHAFHSPMMVPAQTEFQDIVAKHQLNPAALTVISTLTGKILSDSEAVDPAYWGRQLRYGVKFSEAIQAIWEQDNPVLLEVGPRGSATTLAKQNITEPDHHRAVASLRGSESPDEEWTDILRAAGELWGNGLELDWDEFYEKSRRQIVSLPGYPFRRTRFWIGESTGDVVRQTSETSVRAQAPSSTTEDRIISLIKLGSGFELSESDRNRTFIDIGLDSLYLTQFGIGIQNEFAVHIGLRDLIEKYCTISLLSELIDSAQPAQMPRAATDSSKNKLTVNALRPSHLPPCINAFVGKDREGGLGWYREDPDHPGRFERVKVAQ